MSAVESIVFILSLSSAHGWWFFSRHNQTDDRRICMSTPEADNQLRVGFQIFTLQNKNGTDVISDSESILQSGFDATKDTKFLVHGYMDSGYSTWVRRMVQDLLRFYDVNVFSVNWYEGANSQYYGQSAANTRRVGEIVADFIRQLRNVTGASYDSQHLIGLSLGAHVCGFAGASLDGQLARITGMDPAGPCFRFSGPDSRLSKDDAVFVDVIHTDGDHLLQGGFGTELRMGDADFYPNGGENQPGCKRLAQQLLALITDGFKGVGSGMMCSHLRSQHLFRNSINPANSFKAYPCDTQDDYETCTTCGTRGCSRMGYHASPQQHGIYTLRTQNGPPYSFDF